MTGVFNLKDLKVLLESRRGTVRIEADLFLTVELEPERTEVPSMFSLAELERLWDMAPLAARGTENVEARFLGT